METRIEASKAVRMLQIMSARLKETKALFDPIKIEIIQHKDGYRASSMMTNRGRTASVVARFVGLNVEGLEGDKSLCVSADTLISFYEECYGSDEKLKIWDDDVWLKTVNENSEYPTEVKHPMISEDSNDLYALDSFPLTMHDGIPYYHKGTVKPDTEVTIDVAEIQKAIKHKSKVARHATGDRSPKFYDFSFMKDKSMVIIGDDKDMSMTPITKTLKCEVDGPGATFKIGDEELEHVIGVLTGVVTIYCKTDYPIWVTQRGDDFLVGYLVAPKADTGDVEIETDEGGDVEIVEMEDEPEEIDDGEPEEDEPEDIPELDESEGEDIDLTEEPEEVPEEAEESTDSGEDIPSKPEDDNIPEEPEEGVQEEADDDGEDLAGLDLDIS